MLAWDPGWLGNGEGCFLEKGPLGGLKNDQHLLRQALGTEGPIQQGH